MIFFVCLNYNNVNVAVKHNNDKNQHRVLLLWEGRSRVNEEGVGEIFKNMALRSTIKRLGKVIRVSERYIAPMQEMRVAEIMEGVEKQIRGWPGLSNIETRIDDDDLNRYVVITEWESEDSMKKWLKSDLCREVIQKLDTVLDRPVAYRELVAHEDDVFLL